MGCTSPNTGNEEITVMRYICIEPLEEVGLRNGPHPKHHEMMDLSCAPGQEILLEDPDLLELISIEDTSPYPEYYRRTRIYDMIELPLSAGAGKDSGCSSHKNADPGAEHSQEDFEKATSPSSCEPKNDDTNDLPASRNPSDPANVIYSFTVEYQCSPLLKYCTLEEMGYRPIQLM